MYTPETFLLVEFNTSECKVTAYQSTSAQAVPENITRITHVNKAELYVEYHVDLETIVDKTQREVVNIRMVSNKQPVATFYKTNIDPNSSGFDANMKTFAENLSGIILS